MKKYLSTCLTVIAFFMAVTGFAQKDLTLVFKDKVQKGYFDKTMFALNVIGFSDQKEASAFYEKMRAQPEISSVQDLGKDTDGSYKMVAKL